MLPGEERSVSYLVLARKWRPRAFAELVGQEHVVKALANGLDSGRIHHAFLFTGTRGVGKTTVARLLAKALNCEAGVSSTFCGRCAACREIDEGRFVDLIEVDAASRTKVEDTRDLLENVQYSPARGRYKVYLIDEVHMLSTHSFNALLKTLEEPPPHVKFLLATTDPQKLPITVVSRCLQFHLKRLSQSLIVDRLSHILGAEGVDFEAPALPLIARAADGSLRDALSLLDQALVFGAGRVGDSDVRMMLGTIDRTHVVRCLECLIDGDAAAMIAILNALDEQAPDYDQLLAELTLLIQRVALEQRVPGVGGEGFDPALLARLAGRVAAEDLQLYYQIGLTGRRDLGLAPEPRVGFEMTLLRMLAFRPAELLVPMLSPSAAPVAPAAAATVKPKQASAAISAPAVRGPGNPPVVAPPTTLDAASWPALLESLSLTGAARQLAAQCIWLGREGDVIRLRLDPRGEALRTVQTEERVAQALSKVLATKIRLVIEKTDAESASAVADTPARQEERAAEAEVTAARAALEEDPTVRAIKERFGASVAADSVKPNRSTKG
jgi:DNA polymerase-3 subunit gamma/tau